MRGTEYGFNYLKVIKGMKPKSWSLCWFVTNPWSDESTHFHNRLSSVRHCEDRSYILSLPAAQIYDFHTSTNVKRETMNIRGSYGTAPIREGYFVSRSTNQSIIFQWGLIGSSSTTWNKIILYNWLCVIWTHILFKYAIFNTSIMYTSNLQQIIKTKKELPPSTWSSINWAVVVKSVKNKSYVTCYRKCN